MSNDNEQYRQLFIDEAKDHIGTLTQSLLTLEKNPENREVVNTLFRSAHTLKGSSGMMGFKDFQELTHAMEDVFDEMRKGKKASSCLVSVLLDCVDSLSHKLGDIQNNIDGEIPLAQLKNRLQETKIDAKSPELTRKETGEPSQKKETIQLNQSEKELINQKENAGAKFFVVDLKFCDDCSFKAIRANMVLDKIADVAKVVKTIPNNGELDDQRLSQGFQVAVLSKFDEKTIERCAKQILEIEKVDVVPYKEPDSLATITRDENKTPTSSRLENYVISIENQKITKIVADPQTTQSVRVKFDQLDKLMNLVGELVINKIALLQLTSDTRNNSLKHLTENIDRLTADLQDLVMNVRMVPVGQVFDRFPRLVRDLSLKKGKKIELALEGREIDVDRSVLDEIGEPLIHLLRNSIDHGIESPEERGKAGKSETGRIKLNAKRHGNQVIVEVSDDGAGIDPDKIREAAIGKGFATRSELGKMSKDQLINLIFLPGLSTAKEVTETSGRGVGMDVVKTKVSALGGTVHIESKIGAGTKTTIKLPITLAIIQAILVKDAMQTFAIPTSQVSEIVKVRKEDLKSLGRTNAIILRDQVIPIIHMHQLLNLPDSKESEFELLIIYLGDENSKIGLVVDLVQGQQDILVKSLNETLQRIKGISGATILGDGQVVLVLDIPQFVQRIREKSKIES